MEDGYLHAERVWREREEMVLRLRDEGFSYDEMAAHLGIPAQKLRAIGERELNRSPIGPA
jgi:DNA-directed RNA polymerase specialized sigma24 family protein